MFLALTDDVHIQCSDGVGILVVVHVVDVLAAQLVAEVVYLILAEMGTSYVFAFDAKTLGKYRIILRGSSDLNEVAQMTCTLFTGGFPISTMTFHGTNGELDAISREILIGQRFTILRLYVGAAGLKLKDIKFILKDN